MNNKKDLTQAEEMLKLIRTKSLCDSINQLLKQYKLVEYEWEFHIREGLKLPNIIWFSALAKLHSGETAYVEHAINYLDLKQATYLHAELFDHHVLYVAEKAIRELSKFVELENAKAV